MGEVVGCLHEIFWRPEEIKKQALELGRKHHQKGLLAEKMHLSLSQLRVHLHKRIYNDVLQEMRKRN